MGRVRRNGGLFEGILVVAYSGFFYRDLRCKQPNQNLEQGYELSDQIPFLKSRVRGSLQPSIELIVTYPSARRSAGVDERDEVSAFCIKFQDRPSSNKIWSRRSQF